MLRKKGKIALVSFEISFKFVPTFSDFYLYIDDDLKKVKVRNLKLRYLSCCTSFIHRQSLLAIYPGLKCILFVLETCLLSNIGIAAEKRLEYNHKQMNEKFPLLSTCDWWVILTLANCYKVGSAFFWNTSPIWTQNGPWKENPSMAFCVIAILRFLFNEMRPKLTNFRDEITKGSTF